MNLPAGNESLPSMTVPGFAVEIVLLDDESFRPNSAIIPVSGEGSGQITGPEAR